MLNIIIIPPVQCQATVEYIKNIKKMNLEKKTDNCAFNTPH